MHFYTVNYEYYNEIMNTIMTYSTKKIKGLNLNYDKFRFEPTKENGVFKISSTHYLYSLNI